MKMTSSQLYDLRLGHYMITSEAIKHKIKNDRLNQIFFGRLNTHCTKKNQLGKFKLVDYGQELRSH